jgi:hypothetical protein
LGDTVSVTALLFVVAKMYILGADEPVPLGKRAGKRKA